MQRNLKRFATLSVLLLSLSACAISSGVDCLPWEPIFPNELDVITEPTQEQIDDHNAVGEKICGW